MRIIKTLWKTEIEITADEIQKIDIELYRLIYELIKSYVKN